MGDPEAVAQRAEAALTEARERANIEILHGQAVDRAISDLAHRLGVEPKATVKETAHAIGDWAEELLGHVRARAERAEAALASIADAVGHETADRTPETIDAAVRETVAYLQRALDGERAALADALAELSDARWPAQAALAQARRALLAEGVTWDRVGEGYGNPCFGCGCDRGDDGSHPECACDCLVQQALAAPAPQREGGR